MAVPAIFLALSLKIQVLLVRGPSCVHILLCATVSWRCIKSHKKGSSASQTPLQTTQGSDHTSGNLLAHQRCFQVWDHFSAPQIQPGRLRYIGARTA